MKIKDFISNPFVILTTSLVLVLIVSQLIQDGMFMDGSLYVCVSHNLSQGLGSFWEPNYSKTSMIVFREQPPLYFGLMAIFFKLFGSSMYVERLFIFICLILEFIVIKSLWNSAIKEDENKKHVWLPILFFIIIPVVFWSYANLVEETVMVIFASFAVLFVRYATNSEQNTSQLIWILFAAVAIVLSTLTKGIQGSFPLASLFIFWIFERKQSFKKAIQLSFLLFIFFISIYMLMFLFDSSIYFNLKLYLENRLSKAFITGDHDTTSSHFYLLFRLFNELLPVIIILFILVIVKKKLYRIKLNTNYQLSAYAYIFIGLSGTLPLMLTKEQRGFYLLTALPFFAIAFALLIIPLVSVIIKSWNPHSKSYSAFRLTVVLILVGSLVFTFLQAGKCKRDKEALHDIYTFLPLLEQGSIVGLSDDLLDSWNIRNYLIRYKYISMHDSNSPPKYKIISKNTYSKEIDKHYKRINLETELLDLYIKN
jgi:hypothetical protein